MREERHVKKRTLIANVIVWGVVFAVFSAILLWSKVIASDEALEAVYDSTVLMAGITYAEPCASFAGGALAGTLIAWISKIHAGRWTRVVFRVVSILVFGLFVTSPLIIPVAPASVTLVFAVVLVVALEVPWIFIPLGIIYGLGLAPLRPEVVEEMERKKAEARAGKEVHDAIREGNGTKKKRPHKKGRQ